MVAGFQGGQGSPVDVPYFVEPLLRLFGLACFAHTGCAALRCWQHNGCVGVGYQNAVHALPPTVIAGAFQLEEQETLQVVGQDRDEDMGVDATFDVMSVRAVFPLPRGILDFQNKYAALGANERGVSTLCSSGCHP